MRGLERTRTRLLSLAAAGLAAAGLSVVVVGPGSATISGSNFNAGDGNMSVQSSDPHDWADTTLLANVPDSYKGNILPGLPGDDAFNNGAKEDDNPPSVGFGGVPPNKDDFTRMYLAKEHVSTTTSETDYVYMAWLRTNNPGTAFEAFEFNQSSTISSNGVTPVRTAGDVLVLYDLDQGGTIPTISVARWITSNANGKLCDNTKHTAPCWGTRAVQSGTAEEASINDTAFTNPIDGGTVAVRTFGEAALNLQASGIFSTGCVHLGKASLTSRSSSSLDSTMKDLVGPVDVNISNCGTVNIHKQDDTSAHNPLSGVTFTLYTDSSPIGGTKGSEDAVTTYTCTTDTSGDCSIVNVPLGDYWAVEGAAPSGFSRAPDQHVTLTGAALSVSLTFTDNRQPASLKVHKQDDDSPANPLSGVTFTLYTDNAPTGGTRGSGDTVTTFTCTTGSNGDCTISNILPAGDYWVVETGGLTGYAGAADQHVNLALGQNADITSTPFVDQRNFKVIVLVCQQSDNTLYPSGVTIDGTSAGDSLATAGLPSNVDQTALCGITAGAAGDKHYGSHSASANIPQ